MDAVERVEAISFDPLPMDAYESLPERERQLQCIGDVIGYWLKYITKEHEAEALPVTADTHVMLGYDNAPPHWPSVGQLTHWLQVLRATPDFALARSNRDAQPEELVRQWQGDRSEWFKRDIAEIVEDFAKWHLDRLTVSDGEK